MPPRGDHALTPMDGTPPEAAGILVRWAHPHPEEIDTARAEHDAREVRGGSAFTA